MEIRKNQARFGHARIQPRQALQAHRVRQVQVAPARIVTRPHQVRAVAHRNQKLRKNR